MKKFPAKGFTIVEVVIATGVLALAVMTSVTALGYGLRAIDNARAMTFATQILQDNIEDLRCTAPNIVSGWTTGTAVNVSLDAAYANSPFVSGHNYTCSRYVTAVPGKVDGSGSPNLFQVQYSVSWRGLDNQIHTRVMSTQYYLIGLYFYVSQ